jgi:hypothetical protein
MEEQNEVGEEGKKEEEEQNEEEEEEEACLSCMAITMRAPLTRTSGVTGIPVSHRN